MSIRVFSRDHLLNAETAENIWMGGAARGEERVGFGQAEVRL